MLTSSEKLELIDQAHRLLDDIELHLEKIVTGLKASAEKRIKFDVIQIEDGVRMLRSGIGIHHGNWFVRVDLWDKAYRLSLPKNK